MDPNLLIKHFVNRLVAPVQRNSSTGPSVFGFAIALALFSVNAQPDVEVDDKHRQLMELESNMTYQLDRYSFPADFTLLIESNSAHQYLYSRQPYNPVSRYDSASTAKLATALIILHFVEKGLLSLDDQPQQYIASWPTSGNLAQVRLGHLLSFTSGLKYDSNCMTNPTIAFADCVDIMVKFNAPYAEPPGTKFSYRSAHLQVAGMMLIEAAQADDWHQLFEEFQQDTGLFLNSSYELPSTKNPTLATGMYWTIDDFMGFLRTLAEGRFFQSEAFLGELSQGLDKYINKTLYFGEGNPTWHYGFGFWVECPKDKPDCEGLPRISSVGAYGSYVFVDFANKYFGVLAAEGPLGTYLDSYKLMDLGAKTLSWWSYLSR